MTARLNPPVITTASQLLHHSPGHDPSARSAFAPLLVRKLVAACRDERHRNTTTWARVSPIWPCNAETSALVFAASWEQQAPAAAPRSENVPPPAFVSAR